MHVHVCTLVAKWQARPGFADRVVFVCGCVCVCVCVRVCVSVVVCVPARTHTLLAHMHAMQSLLVGTSYDLSLKHTTSLSNI